MSLSISNQAYGIGDTSFKAAGGTVGLMSLCRDFYLTMDSLPAASHIRKMHRDDLEYMQEKLALFLTTWLGGPNDWFAKYNYPPIPLLHQEFVINEEEKLAWLECMDQAIEKQDWESTFKMYLKNQFRGPAEMVQKFSRSH